MNDSLFGHNPDWFLHTIANLDEKQHAMLFMLWEGVASQ
jgi:hypothetical protein